MSQPSSPRATGSILALSIVGGVVIGAILGQSSVGFLIGMGIGVAISVAFWLFDRRR